MAELKGSIDAAVRVYTGSAFYRIMLAAGTLAIVVGLWRWALA